MFSGERKSKKEHGNTAELDLHFYLLSHLPFQVYIRNMPTLQPTEKYRDSQAICTVELVYMKQSSSSSMEPSVSPGIQVRNES